MNFKSLTNYPLYLAKNKCQISKKIFILGNSQPECGINDSILSNQLENVALSGEALFYSNIKARVLLSKCKIDTIIFGFNPNRLHSIKNVIDDKRLVNDYKKNFFRLSFHEHMFLFENNFNKTLKTWFSMTPKIFFENKDRISGGFRPLNSVMQKSAKNKWMENPIRTKMPIDSNRVLMDNGFYTLLKLVDSYPEITFIFMRFPEHPSIFKNSCLFDKAVNDLNTRQNTLFFDFSLAIKDNSFFADEQHLNRKGADSFTILVAKQLQLIGVNDACR